MLRRMGFNWLSLVRTRTGSCSLRIETNRLQKETVGRLTARRQSQRQYRTSRLQQANYENIVLQYDCIACLEDPGSMGNGQLIYMIVMGRWTID